MKDADTQDQGLFDPVESLYPEPEAVKDEEEPVVAADDAEPVEAAEEEPAEAAAEEAEDIAEPAEGEEPAEEVGDDSEVVAIEEFDFGGKDFKTLTANVTVDGETKAVPLAEMLKSYQISEAGEKRLREADELKDRARQTLEAQNEQWQTNLEVLPQVAHLIAEEKVLELHRKNLETIRQSNPAEYAARTIDINRAQAEIDQQKQGFSSQIMERSEQARTVQQQAHAELLQTEMGKLLEVRPELTDKKHWTEFTSNVVEYAKGYGIEEADVRGVTNHSMLLILDKARRWDEAQGDITATRKKPTAALKALRPGAKSDKKPTAKTDVEILYG